MRKLYFFLLFLPVLLLAGAGPVFAQGAKVEGVVSDAGGNALAGVAVSIAGTTKATVTDRSGHFEISGVAATDELYFSHVGYASRVVKVGHRSVVNVVLDADAVTLEEVVATGYQTISRERATGSFSKVSASDWEDRRVSDVSNILEGRIAGYSNGLIRGTTSFFAGTKPLYVIDGFPVETTRYNSSGSLEEVLPNLNTDDIESVTVLKDAAATSIYGARAANGVVVIVTKKARADQTHATFSTNLALTPYNLYTGNVADGRMVTDIERELISSNPIFATPANAQNYLDKAVYTSQGMKALLNYYAQNISSSELESTLAKLSSNGHSYLKDVKDHGKRNAFSQQYNLSVAHGTAKSSTNVSFTYINNKAHDIYSGNESFGGNVTTVLKPAKWISVDFGTYINFLKATNQTYSLLSPTYGYSVYDRLVNDDGTPFTYLASERRSLSDNSTINTYGLYSMDATPLEEIAMNRARTRNFNNRSFARVNIKFTDYLRYSGSFQYEYGNSDYSLLYDKRSYYVRSLVNSYSSSDATGTTFNVPYGDILNRTKSVSNGYNFRQQIDFDKTFGGVHNVTALAGFEVRHMKLDLEGRTRYNYDSDMLTYSPVNEAKYVGQYNYGLLGSGYMSADPIRELVNRYVSMYGNAAYNYDNRYTVTGSLRWDRSNLWGTSSKYQNKPAWSVGGAWNVNNEAFFDVAWVNMLKMRVSYGIGGNIAKDSSPYLTVNYYNNSNVGGIYGVVSTQPNPLLSWEKTSTFNVGIDFAVLNNRIHGTIDYYHKKGTDLLSNTMGNPTEGYGFSTMKINNGEVTNKGVEVAVYGQIIKKADFGFNASVVFAYNKNKVDYATATAPVSYLQIDYPNAYPRVGDPYNGIYGYKWAGLSDTGLPQIYNSAGEKTAFQPSDAESIVYIGTTVPVWNGSFNMDFRYRNLTLSMMFLYEGGHMIRNSFLPRLNTSYSNAAGGYIPMTNGMINKDIDNRWRAAGDEAGTDVPRMMITASDYAQFSESIYTNADIHVYKAANLRLRNITLGYRIPQTISRKLYVQNARVNFSVENVFTVAQSKTAKYLLGGYVKPTFVFGFNLNF